MVQYFLNDKLVSGEDFCNKLIQMKGTNDQVIDTLLAGLPVTITRNEISCKFLVKR